jgi:hypothetical protein
MHPIKLVHFAQVGRQGRSGARAAKALPGAVTQVITRGVRGSTALSITRAMPSCFLERFGRAGSVFRSLASCRKSAAAAPLLLSPTSQTREDPAFLAAMAEWRRLKAQDRLQPRQGAGAGGEAGEGGEGAAGVGLIAAAPSYPTPASPWSDSYKVDAV